MTTKELLYVKTVADEHNISKAAKKIIYGSAIFKPVYSAN